MENAWRKNFLYPVFIGPFDFALSNLFITSGKDAKKARTGFEANTFRTESMGSFFSNWGKPAVQLLYRGQILQGLTRPSWIGTKALLFGQLNSW